MKGRLILIDNIRTNCNKVTTGTLKLKVKAIKPISNNPPGTEPKRPVPRSMTVNFVKRYPTPKLMKIKYLGLRVTSL